MRRYAGLGVMVLVAVGCSASQQPARAALRTAAGAVTVALSPEADKFDPEEVSALQRRLADLKLAYQHRDYSAVIDDAPGVTSAANALLQTVSAAELTETRQLSEWAQFSKSLPILLGAVHARIDALNRAGHSRSNAHLKGAREELGEADREWDQALNAHLRGELGQALAASKQAQSSADAAAAAIELPRLAGV